ncbi:helicase-related protein [Desulfobacca acetoxidans]
MTDQPGTERFMGGSAHPTDFRDHPWRLSYRSSATGPGGKPVNILHDFYIPVLQWAVRYDRVAGYFRSTSLAAASQGFSAFAGRKGKIRLIVGADLDPKDVQAILNAYAYQGSDVLPAESRVGTAHPDISQPAIGMVGTAHPITDPLVKALEAGLEDPASWPENVCHGVQLLGWLIARQVLEIKVALRVHARSGVPLPFDSVEDGYVHMKWGVFADALGNRMYISGSLNESKTALTLNAENIDVHCEWRGETEQQRVEEADREFQNLWQDQAGGLRVLSLPEAVQQRLINISAGMSRPREIDGTSAAPLEISPPSALERLQFALIKDGPLLPGGRFVGLETAPITPWPHQQIVARRVISTWPFSYLLCDEVGLGKTIEAGLIIRSLYLSGLAKRVLIAAPASLTRQWHREMASKFFLPFGRAVGGTPLTHEYLLPVEEKQPAPSLVSPDLTIISTGLLVRAEQQAALQAAKRCDITLIDEAHYARRKNPTQGLRAEPKLGKLYRVIAEILRPRSTCLLMATATPMQLDPVEVFDLIRLTNRLGPFQYDPGLCQWYYDILSRLVRGQAVTEIDWSFLRQAVLDVQRHDPLYYDYVLRVVVDGRIRLALRRWLDDEQIPRRNDLPGFIRLIFCTAPLSRVMLRHNRSLLEIYRAHDQLHANLAKREILPLEAIRFTPQEQTCYDQLEEYCQKLASHITSGLEADQKAAIGFYLSFLRLRFASSLFAIRQTLERRLAKVKYTLTHLADRGETGQDELDWEDLLDEGDDDQLVAETMLANRKPEDLQWEMHHLHSMLLPLRDLSGTSSKMQVLLRVLGDRRIAGTHRIQPVVIFTRFFDTLTDIVKRLRTIDIRLLIGAYSGQGGQYIDPKTFTLVGVEREEIKRRFLRGEIDILVCTDAAAEGLNLQSADLLINFDLPWNPMKVEQRIGRIDRIGQKYETVYVLNLCYAGSAEEIVYGRLLSRLSQIGLIVGGQQLSLLPVTREEFQELAERKLSEPELEKRAKERAKLAKERIKAREMPAEDLYQIYSRLRQANDASKAPVTLETIWEVLSRSLYLQDLGCQIWAEVEKKTIILHNIPGIPDGTALTASRDTYEYGIEQLERPLHFATYGDPVFDTLLNHMATFALPECIRRLEIQGPISSLVGYAIASLEKNGQPQIRLLYSGERLKIIQLVEDMSISEADSETLRTELNNLMITENNQPKIAPQIEILNQQAGLSQVTLGYLIIHYLIRFRQKMGTGDEHFWPEVRALENLCRDKAVILIPDIPKAQAQKLYGLLFDLHIPALGDSARITAPTPIVLGALDATCRLANKLHVRRADLLTRDVLRRLDREINNILS